MPITTIPNPLYIFVGFLIAAIVIVRILRRRNDEQ